MASVVSRNPFDLLGDSEDTETVVSKEKEQPSKEPVVVQKKIDRSRASPKEARIRHEYPQRGGHKSSTSNRSNEDTRSAPRDRNVGPRLSGRREEGGGGGGGGGGDYQSTRSVRGARPNERGRGGRGGRRGGRDYDRHSGTGRYDSEKKENQGWGNPTESSYEAAATTTTTTTVDSSWNTEANDVKSNWNDNANDTSGSWGNTTEEKSATTDAWATTTTTTTTTEEKSGDNNDAWNTNDTTTAESWVQQPESEIKVEDNNNTTGDSAPPPEIEETTKTLDEYLAEKSQKSLDLSLPEARKPNEGADDSQWKEAVLLEKEEDEDALFTGKEQSYRLKNKNKKSKNFVDITQTFDGNRGGPSRGRGRGRGGRGSGRGREDRDRDRDGRDDNNSNRRHRGGGGGGGGGGRSGLVNLDDQRAFPSLGAS